MLIPCRSQDLGRGEVRDIPEKGIPPWLRHRMIYNISRFDILCSKFNSILTIVQRTISVAKFVTNYFKPEKQTSIIYEKYNYIFIRFKINRPGYSKCIATLAL